MLEFKKMGLKDIPVFREYLKYKVENNCDCTIGAAFLWRDYYNTFFAIYEDMLFIKVSYPDGLEAFTFPLAKDKVKALKILEDYCKSEEQPLVICTVTDTELDIIDEVFPKYEIKKERDSFDYLYNSSDMVNFAGRKYSGQRNHINKFKKLYDEYGFYEINKDNLQEAREFFENFIEMYSKETESYNEEAEKILELFDNYESYGLIGGVLRVKDKIIAMSIGEIIGNTLYVHVEKADISYHGAYQMIVQLFASNFVTEEVKYINREDDMGDMGLRTSKLSYHPVKLIEKAEVFIK